MIENLQFTAWEFGGVTETKTILFPLNKDRKPGKKLTDTFYYKIFEELIEMEVGESICKNKLLIKLYGKPDKWLIPRFNVMYQRAKRMTEYNFKNWGDTITRLN